MNIYELLDLAFKVSYFRNDVAVLKQRSVCVCVCVCVCAHVRAQVCMRMGVCAHTCTCVLSESVHLLSFTVVPFAFIFPDCD